MLLLIESLAVLAVIVVGAVIRYRGYRQSYPGSPVGILAHYASNPTLLFQPLLIGLAVFGALTPTLDRISALISPAANPIDYIIAKSDFGTVHISYPEQLNDEGSGTVKVELLPNLGNTSSISRNTDQPVPLTRRMSVALVGDKETGAFDSLDPETQAVSFVLPTTWQWRVSGKGPSTIGFTVGVRIHSIVDGTDTERTVAHTGGTIAYHQSLFYVVTLFVKAHWKFIITVVLIPLAVYLLRQLLRLFIWVYNWLRRRRRGRIGF